MSGIVGIFWRDGRPVERAGLERMVETLSHRGPDGAGTWSEGCIGLGHRMLWTTPESLHEQLPLVTENGDLVITADARIDNRDELIKMLDLSDGLSAQIPDSQLILAAYRKWGERCPTRLIGDYAFAIWDKNRQALVCARDHFGIRPFYYYQTDRLFAFASEIKALFCLPEVPRRLCELRVGYYLAMAVEDNAITFYQDVFRLPPAQAVTVRRDELQRQTFWSLDPSRELRLKSDEAYAEAFRECFTEAVRCRLRSAYPVGSLLSGGLDSASVTCVARNLLAQNGEHRLHTISGVYDITLQCDERSYINDVLTQENLESHFVQIDRLSPLNDFGRVCWLGDEPFTSPTLYLVWALSQAAHAQGVRVILDGIDGDTAVSHGKGYLADLARNGQWAAFALNAKALAQHENLPPVYMLLQRYGAPYLTELVRGGKWLTLATALHALSGQLDFPRRSLLKSYALKPVTPKPMLQLWRAIRGHSGPVEDDYPIINRKFAQKNSLEERIEAVTAPRLMAPRTAREEHHRVLVSGIMPYIFELANRTSTAFSVEARHPFSDRRLIELCLALPAEQKLYRGWTRMVMRRALTGILPEKIQWRGGKTLNSAAFTHGLLKHESELLEDVIINDPSSIEPYADIAALRKVYDRYLSSRNSRSDEMKVWHAVTLAAWLRHTNLAA